MKIPIVVTPAKKPSDEPGSLGRVIIEYRGSAPPAEKAGGERLVIDIDGMDTPMLRAQLDSVCREIEQSFARAGADGARLRFELPDGAEGMAEGAANPEPVEDPSVPAKWTADGAKLRDINGTGARVALPLVLSAVQPHGRQPVARENAAANEMVDSRGAGRDPYRRTLNRMADCIRTLACRGAKPVAVGYRLTFPGTCRLEDLVVIKEGIRAVAEASACLALPIVDQVVAGQDEAAGSGVGPLVDLWGVGRFENERHITGECVRSPGERLMFLGETPGEIGGSLYLKAVHGIEAGAAPSVEFPAEKKLQGVLLTLIRAGVVSAARPLAEGGVMAAAFGMLSTEGRTLGARLDLTPLGGARADALLFGESQSCVVLAVVAGRVGTVLSEAHMRGVSAALIGEVTDDAKLGLKTRSLETEWSMAELRNGSPVSGRAVAVPSGVGA